MTIKTMKNLTALLIFVLAMISSAVAQESQGDSYAKGLGLFYTGNYQEALDTLKQAASAQPEDPRPCFFAGVCLSRLGQTDKAVNMYKIASAREYLPGGRQIDSDQALRRIQGAERQAIQQARKEVALLWQQKQKERQVRKYGKTLSAQTDLMTRENMADDNKKDGADSNIAAKSSGLPTVAPITPLNREEREVVESNKIYDTKVDEFQFFRDDIGKTVLSTAERKRLAEREAKVTYTDPMDKPAADGSKFVNIYDPLEVVADSKPYSGVDDPDDLYAEAEKSPLMTAGIFFNGLAHKGNKMGKGTAGGMGGVMSDGGMMGGEDMMMGGGDDMMMGGGMSPGGPGMGNAAGTSTRKTGNDTKLMFKNDKGNNPFQSFSGSQPEGSINPFKIDRDFVPPADEKTAGESGSPDGMMSSPM